MNYKDLIERLDELIDWAIGNQWETPIDLSDKLIECRDIIKGKEAKVYYEYPAITKNPMFAIGYCSKCGAEINDGNWKYCPCCGAALTETVSADCENCKYFGGLMCDHIDEEDACMGYEPYVKNEDWEKFTNKLYNLINEGKIDI